jgi:predicted  nucleic acid-binding Zn-ribbon protein
MGILDRILANQSTILTNQAGLKSQGEKIMLDLTKLQADIDGMKVVVPEIAAEIADLKNQLFGSETDDQAKMDDLETQIADLKAQLEALVTPVPGA